MEPYSRAWTACVGMTGKGRRWDEVHRFTGKLFESNLLLQIQKESVRAVDVSNYMALSKPSVSNALKKLRTERLLTVDKEKNLILTDEGLQAAREIFSRHSFFERLLIDAGVDEGQAHEDACSLEHAISRQSFAVLKDRLEGLAAQKAAD